VPHDVLPAAERSPQDADGGDPQQGQGQELSQQLPQAQQQWTRLRFDANAELEEDRRPPPPAYGEPASLPA
jgi:hypothetical protein